jgi:hypothetical protein
MRHLLGNIPPEDITVTWKLGYDVNAKQMTAKRSTADGGVLHTSLPLFLIILARNKSQEILKTLHCVIQLPV